MPFLPICLFLVVDSLMRKVAKKMTALKLNTTVTTITLTDLEFTDDIVLISQTVSNSHLQRTILFLIKEANPFGLTINLKPRKTEVRYCA